MSATTINNETVFDSDEENSRSGCEAPKERKKYFQLYKELDLQKAIGEVASGEITFGKASRKYGIPKTTLIQRVKGSTSGTHGNVPNLTKDVEEKLVEWVLLHAKMGDPRTRDQLVHAAADLAEKVQGCRPFKNKLPSSPWVKLFVERHPQVSFRTPSAVTRASANVTRADVTGFIRNFRGWLQNNGLEHMMNEPSAFGNLDETAFALNSSPRTVLAAKGGKNVYRVENAKSKESATHLFTFLADGQVLDPFLVLKKSQGNKFEMAHAAGEVGMRIAIAETENGWQTKESFFDYVSTHLVKELDERNVIRTKEHPFFLFVDGHTSHDSFQLYEWCRERNIFIVKFFPNATHILQPADVGVFGPGKSIYSKEVQRWKQENGNRQLSMVDHIKVLKKVVDKAMTPDTIKNAFKKTGLFPLDENNVPVERCLGGEGSRVSNVQESTSNVSSDLNDDIIPNTSVNILPNLNDEDSPDLSDNVLPEHIGNFDVLSDMNESVNDQICRLMKEIEERVNSLKPLIELKHCNSLPIVQIIDFGLKQLSSQIAHSSDFAVQNGSMQQHLTNLPIAQCSEDIQQVLTPPQPFKRSGVHKNYRLKISGVMNSDEMIADLKQKIENDRQAEGTKQQKRIQREAIRNMKKEKKDSTTTRPRGRPPKKVQEEVPAKNPIECDENDELAKKYPETKKRKRDASTEKVPSRRVYSNKLQKK